MIRRLASLHWLQPGTVRQLRRYYQDALTSCRPSHRASLPPLGGTSVALVLFAPRRTSAPPGPGVGHPVTPAGMLPRRRQDLASSWGTPIVRLHMFSPTPAGLLAPDHCGAAAWPLVIEWQRLPRKVFRRSIAWLSDSLRAPCAAWSASQCGLLQHHARLASSCWSSSTGRASHPQGSDEGSQSCQLHLIPPSQAYLAQVMQPPQRRNPAICWRCGSPLRDTRLVSR